MSTGQDLYARAKKIIPGGTQLLSKRPEMFLPNEWPAYYSKAKGCQVWDLDGKSYFDFSTMGIGCCALGYADPEVNEAVIKSINNGSQCTLNCPEEVELAEKMIQLHPWAEMVRFARGGGEAMAIAVRIARAFTGEDTILFCGYHGWHDWYLAANLSHDHALDGQLLPGLKPTGVPRALCGTSLPFHYNDVEEFKRLWDIIGNHVGAVVMEPVRSVPPDPVFINVIRERTRSVGVPLIIDEVTAGFRVRVGGSHFFYGIEPNIAVFAKALGNGYPIAAIIGRGEVMQAAQDTFISSTSWTERIGPTAALATIMKMEDVDLPSHLFLVGNRVQEEWKRIAGVHKLKIGVSGIPPLSHFEFKVDGIDPLLLKSLFTQYMLDQGFLASTSLYSSFAHKDQHVDLYLDAVNIAFARISSAIAAGNPLASLRGPVCHSTFKRLV